MPVHGSAQAIVDDLGKIWIAAPLRDRAADEIARESNDFRGRPFRSQDGFELMLLESGTRQYLCSDYRFPVRFTLAGHSRSVSMRSGPSTEGRKMKGNGDESVSDAAGFPRLRLAPSFRADQWHEADFPQVRLFNPAILVLRNPDQFLH